MRSLLPTLLFLLCIGCAADRRAPTTSLHNDAESLEGREDIIEVVFRHICQPEPVEREVSHNLNLVHKVYFLAIGDSQDPSPDLLKRLADLKAPVKPISAGEWKEFFIYDKATGQRGAAFYIQRISMLSRDDAEVDAVMHPGGGLSASGTLYRVTRKDGKWVVTGERLSWSS